MAGYNKVRWEDELLALARNREREYAVCPYRILDAAPAILRRQLRYYLAELANCGRLKKTYDGPRIEQCGDGLVELVGDEVEFTSESRLEFNIRLKETQLGWLVQKFRFHLHLQQRRINMMRIHLNETEVHDSLRIPMCHLHIDGSGAHIPFPIMNPRMTIHLICAYIEPDLGT